MSGLRSHRRLSAWIALVAMAWLVLAPSVSHTLRSLLVPDSPWREVCSAAKAPGGSAATQAPGDPDSPAHAAGHGLCCAGMAVELGLAPAAVSVLPPAAMGAEWCASAAAGRAESFSWRAGQPRAPPSRA
jgi:hypothetical protein